MTSITVLTPDWFIHNPGGGAGGSGGVSNVYYHLATVTNGTAAFQALPQAAKDARAAGQVKVIWYRNTSVGLAPDPAEPKHADYVGTLNGSVVDLIEGYDTSSAPTTPPSGFTTGVFLSDSLIGAGSASGRQLDKYIGGAEGLMAWKVQTPSGSTGTQEGVNAAGLKVYGGSGANSVIYDSSLTPLPNATNFDVKFEIGEAMHEGNYANNSARIYLGGTDPFTGARWGFDVRGVAANGGTPAHRRLSAFQFDGSTPTTTPLIEFPNGYDLYGKGPITFSVRGGVVSATVDTYTTATPVTLTPEMKDLPRFFAFATPSYTNLTIKNLSMEVF